MILGPTGVFSLKLLFVRSGLTWQEKNYPIISNQSCCCRGQIAIYIYIDVLGSIYIRTFMRVIHIQPGHVSFQQIVACDKTIWTTIRFRCWRLNAALNPPKVRRPSTQKKINWVGLMRIQQYRVVAPCDSQKWCQAFVTSSRCGRLFRSTSRTVLFRIPFWCYFGRALSTCQSSKMFGCQKAQHIPIVRCRRWESFLSASITICFRSFPRYSKKGYGAQDFALFRRFTGTITTISYTFKYLGKPRHNADVRFFAFCSCKVREQDLVILKAIIEKSRPAMLSQWRCVSIQSCEEVSCKSVCLCCRSRLLST